MTPSTAIGAHNSMRLGRCPPWHVLIFVGLAGITVASLMFWYYFADYVDRGFAGTSLIVLLTTGFSGMGLLLLGLSLAVLRPVPAIQPRLRPADGPPVWELLALVFVLPLALLTLPGLAGTLLYAATGFDAIGRTVTYFHAQLPSEAGDWWSLYVLVQPVGLALVVCGCLVRTGLVAWQHLGWRTLLGWPGIFAFLVGVGLWLATVIARHAVDVGLPGLRFNFWMLPPRPAWPTLAAVLIGGVIVAPFAEEILFRGYLLRRWTASHGPIFGTLASAGLFAALHFDPVAFPVLLLMGLILAWFTQRTGYLAPAMLTHAAYNLICLGLQFGR